MKLFLGILALALLAGTARADSVWTYTGNSTEGLTGGAVNLCKCALSGTLTVDAAFNVLSYSFTDGIVTLNQTDSTIALHPFLNGEQVPFLFWGMSITAPDAFLFSMSYDIGEATDSGTGGLNVVGNRGTWVDPIVSSPEPGTIALLGMGLAALTFGLLIRPNLSRKTIWLSISFFLLLPLNLVIAVAAYIANQHDEWVERRLA